MITIAIEVLLIFLLMITIGYCYVLDRRLKALRAGHADLREVISDLVETTGIAETAIVNLRATADDVDVRLTSKLNEARVLTGQLGAFAQVAQSPGFQRPTGVQRPVERREVLPVSKPIAASSTTPAPAGHNIFLRKVG